MMMETYLHPILALDVTLMELVVALTFSLVPVQVRKLQVEKETYTLVIVQDVMELMLLEMSSWDTMLVQK
jgi:hypothetical protein